MLQRTPHRGQTDRFPPLSSPQENAEAEVCEEWEGDWGDKHRGWASGKGGGRSGLLAYTTIATLANSLLSRCISAYSLMGKERYDGFLPISPEDLGGFEPIGRWRAPRAIFVGAPLGAPTKMVILVVDLTLSDVLLTRSRLLPRSLKSGSIAW